MPILTSLHTEAPTQLDNILTLGLVALLALVAIIAIIRKAVSNKKAANVVVEEVPAPVVEKTRAELGDLAKSDEDVLSYIAFPNLAEKFFEERKAKEENMVTYTITEA